MEGNESNGKPENKKKFLKVCECGKEIHVISTYYYHKKRCAAVKNITSKENFVCKEESCDFKSMFASDLRRHLKSIHEIDSGQEIKVFQNYIDFENWKKDLEARTKAKFISRTPGSSAEDMPTVEYFYCNRSGTYNSKSTGKRSLKFRGSRKIGANCTATIKVETDQHTGTITVTAHTIHYGHENELIHLPLPKEDKEHIANHLALGIGPSRVLRNIFVGDVEEAERKHYSTKRDCYNISNKYGLEKIQKHANDCLSVDAYVEEHIQNESVLFYKRQGEENYHHPKNKICLLEKNDFALGIMTPFQKRMMKDFGNNIICVDATRGTNSYDFKLVTVLVLDDYREGIPVAWLISNKETSIALTMFFEHMKREVGNISSRVFMSDKAPQYFNSWKDVFEGEPKKLLCHWHVHHDWQKQLNKIGDRTVASNVYKGLCMLLEECDKFKFEELLRNTVEQLKLNPTTEEFGRYFKTEWLCIKEEWAKCFRKGSGINTNNFVENFHRNLKHGEGYLHGKHGTRVDRCLSVLFKYNSDMARERLIKLEKGKGTWKITEINKRHRIALTLSEMLIRRTSTMTWEVKSEKSIASDTTASDNLYYKVSKQPLCALNCILKCQFCDICLHSYSCNCPDGLTATNICKHVHLVVLHENKGSPENTEQQDIEQSELLLQNTEEQVSTNFSNTRGDSSSDQSFLLKSINPESRDIEKIRKNVLEKHEQLFNKIRNCKDYNYLCMAKEHINNAFHILTLAENSPVQIPLIKDNGVVRVPHNKKSEKQPRFISTKNKKKKTNIRYAKPTTDKKIDLEYQILNAHAEGKKSDHPYTLECISQSISSPLYIKNLQTATHTSSLLKQVIKFLQYFISAKKVTDIIKAKGKAKEEDIEPVAEKVSDSVVDSMSSEILEHTKQYINENAWLIMSQVLDIKKRNWACATCSTLTTKLNMICCDSCQKWYHWKCQHVNEEPKEERWECKKCILCTGQLAKKRAKNE